MHAADVTISDLEVMVEAQNYRRWIYRRIAPFLGRRILEVGAGIGNFTTLLLDRELVIAVDVYRPCVDYFEKRFADKPNVMPVQLDIADPAARALDRYECDTVICFNVLEHVEDDRAALSHMHSALGLGGRLVLLVPAFQFLYGSVDRALGHHRRYTKGELVLKVHQSGFDVEGVFYMNVIGMAGWFLNNRVLKRRQESLAQIRLFDRFIAPWAERAERFVRPRIGLSLIVIGTRDGARNQSVGLSNR